MQRRGEIKETTHSWEMSSATIHSGTGAASLISTSYPLKIARLNDKGHFKVLSRASSRCSRQCLRARHHCSGDRHASPEQVSRSCRSLLALIEGPARCKSRCPGSVLVTHPHGCPALGVTGSRRVWSLHPDRGLSARADHHCGRLPHERDRTHVHRFHRRLR